MTDFLVQVGASKLALSAGLASLAWAVHRRFHRPSVSYSLWLLVLVTLVAPSVITVPVVGAGALGAGATEAGAFTVPGGNGVVGPGLAPVVVSAKVLLVLLWGVGSAAVLVGSLLRVRRFHRCLRSASDPAPPALQRMAGEIARRMGLARVPVLYTTGASLSPMVWWIGGPIRVVVPNAVLAAVDGDALRWIVGHELAHVRRRDHWVRWLEWLACVAFWWNPITWWARRRLRDAEELCCDALVLDAFDPDPRAYAGTLVTVVDVLSVPETLRAPAFASGAAGSGRTGLIERRLKMIIDGAGVSKAPRWQRVVLGLFMVCALPLGLTYCGRDEARVDPSRVDTLRVEHGGDGTVRINDVPAAPDEVKTVVRELLGEAPSDIVTVVVDDTMPWAYVDGVQKALGEAKVSRINFLRNDGRPLTRERR